MNSDITQHYAAYLANWRAQNSRLQDQRRILNKLEALWNARPGETLGETLLTAISRHATYVGDFTYYTSDSEVEAVLDRALAECGVTVNGGWKS